MRRIGTRGRLAGAHLGSGKFRGAGRIRVGEIIPDVEIAVDPAGDLRDVQPTDDDAFGRRQNKDLVLADERLANAMDALSGCENNDRQ